MRTRVITGVIFTLIVLAFLLPGPALPWLPLVFFALIALAMAIELQQALVKLDSGVSLIASMLGGLLCLSPVVVWLLYRDLRPGWSFITLQDPELDAIWRTDMIWLLGLGIAVAAAFAFLYTIAVTLSLVLSRGPNSLPSALDSTMSSWYIGLPFATVPLFMFAVPNGWRWLLIGVFSAWISDVLCYFVGSKFCHTPIVPHISPNKTLEGTVGGLAGSALIGGLFFMLFMRNAPPVPRGWGEAFAFGAVAGLLLSMVEQLGDWLASAIKRRSHIKDFSHILPGHGGLLDRFDGVLLTLPTTLALSVIYLVLQSS